LADAGVEHRDSGYRNIGLGKIVSFEEQRLAAAFGQSVAKAVSEVQPCGMAAFAELSEGGCCEAGLIDAHWNYFYCCILQSATQFRLCQGS
jgi:hypothetical protein